MPTPAPRKAVALVAGIGAYRHATRIPTLRYAARDARGLARVLSDPEVCAFPPDRVAVLTNRQAHRTELVRRLSGWLPVQSKGADLALIYFAGHGVVHRVAGRDEGFLLPHDADPDNPIAAGIAMSDLARWIEDIQARAVVVCLDCCHAGFLPQEGMSLRGSRNERDMQIQPSLINQLAGKGRFLIASCDRGQKSIEAEEFRHGLFTHHLLRGLIEEGDGNGDGKVSVAELFAYVSAAVKKDSHERFGLEQTPWTSATYSEEVILSTVSPGRKPPSLEAARSTVENDAPITSGDNEAADFVARLRELRRKPDPTHLPFVFRLLTHKDEPVRSKARAALRALKWDKVTGAVEKLVRKDEAEPVGDVLDGLAALEAHEDVVSLLDRLAELLRGAQRDRAVWLLDRKRLALERERLAEVFRDKHSNYEILKVLGPGLYTGAYQAKQELSGLEVVVRVLRPEYAAQPLVRSHFLDLATRSVRLIHENLALTREVRAFADCGLYFAVRDYIDGPTLREVLTKGRKFDPLQAIKILRQVLAALTPLHRDGVVHAGIKPSNIFLTRNDHVILGDPSLPLPAVGFDMPRLAYDFRYAPPELFRGGGLTPAADLYALGCVAHELFRGQPPFVSDVPYELIAKHERDAAPVVRDPAERWLARLLAKGPAARYATLADVILALNEVEDDYRRPPAPPPAAVIARIPEILTPTSPTVELRPEDLTAGPPTLSAEPPSSVHLLQEQSLMAYEGRESIVPLTVGGAPPMTMPPADDGATTGGIAPAAEVPALSIPGYEILEVLGQGGMGVVYRARQARLNRIVAIKAIRADWNFGREALRRFQAEAEAIARLQHPNILQIYDVGEHAGQPFIVMEYCVGASLASRLRGAEPLPPAEAAGLVRTLAGAVHYAHERGVIHRDLKPSNVLLNEDGTPKIVDWGLAKRLDQDDVNQTQSGVIIGTPSYMAPEQARGDIKAVGPPADIYSLGSMLYELLTGRPPFRGASSMEMLMQAMNELPVSPRRLVPSVPRDLETIVLRCLEKEPAKRYASAVELADDLGRFLAGEPITARSRAKRSWWPFGR